MIARFEVFQDCSKKWRFRLKAENGKIVANSQAYTCKRNAEIGIKAIRDCANNSIILYK